MNEISIAFAVSYGNSSPNQKYMPMIKKLENKLCGCYGIGFPQNYQISDEPVAKMHLTKISTRISRFVVMPLSKLIHYPSYYVYWSNIKIFDQIFAKRVANDESKIVLTSPLLVKTVEQAKKNGKIVVLESGNSEPQREYTRIKSEYDKFGIKHQYIYGNVKYCNTCMRSMDLADYIISISKVSMQTYIDAGYNLNKFKLISMAGTDFKIQPFELCQGKKKAFITTAFHNFVKGTHHVLLAWKKAAIEEIPLIVVGRLCEDMQEFVDRNGPFDNVEFVGSRSDLKEWYKQFDAVGILMSLSEGAGRVTPEMMSFGFPMIVSPDATCDLVRNQYNGFIVDSLDEDAIAEKMRWFAEDWERVHKLRSYVLKSVAERKMKDYSLELCNFLESLI